MPVYPLNLGDLVAGKYRVDAILGEGGMGVVYAATHLELRCPVALKVIRDELNQIPELTARLLLEARAAAQIRSEHVCRVLDVGRLDSGTPFVVMEYLHGRTLGSVLRAKGRLSETAAVDYVLEACEAIAEAHRAGFVHRDLKPENLFLAEYPNGDRAIKVLDFGISKVSGVNAESAAHRLTNPSAAMGSPHYMAPEQMLAAHDVDARADIWALGTILHELVTGHLAFTGHSLPIVCAAVLQSTPTPVRHYSAEISAGLEQVILACLAKDREQRPHTVADFARRLAPYGSAQAAESAARIVRLFDETPVAVSTSVLPLQTRTMEPNHGQVPHALAPDPSSLPAAQQRPTPVETATAVASTKQSSELSHAADRKRLVALGISLLLLVPAAWGWFQLRRPTESTSGPFRSTEAGVPSTPEASQAMPAEAGGSAGNPLERSSSSATTAARSPSISLTVAPPQSSNERGGATPVPKPATVIRTLPRQAPLAKGKGTAPDPYDAENFGGRR